MYVRWMILLWPPFENAIWHMCVPSHFSRVRLYVTLWSAACQAPPSKNTGVGFHALLQGIFLTHRSNPGLLQCRLILYRLNHHPEGINTKQSTMRCIIVTLLKVTERMPYRRRRREGKKGRGEEGEGGKEGRKLGTSFNRMTIGLTN